MTNGEAINWLINITADIGKAEHRDLWHYEQALSEIREILESEPERKTGRWIYKNDLKQFFCDQCGEPSLTDDDVYIYDMYFPNFCPNCGADMRGEQDETD